jgi:hypothetical protein
MTVISRGPLQAPSSRLGPVGLDDDIGQPTDQTCPVCTNQSRVASAALGLSADQARQVAKASPSVPAFDQYCEACGATRDLRGRTRAPRSALEVLNAVDVQKGPEDR